MFRACLHLNHRKFSRDDLVLFLKRFPFFQLCGIGIEKLTLRGLKACIVKENMENIPVSTKTIIATSNVRIDIIQVFQKLPVPCDDETAELKLLYYQNQTRGDESQMKKKTKKCFRNAVNVVVCLKPNKMINFKLSKNGKFQVTGCKNEDHAVAAVRFFLRQLMLHTPESVHLDSSNIRVFFQTVMTNIDFSLGFLVNRQKLDMMLNNDTPFHSLLETSFGYTGVNIKFPLDMPWWKLDVPVISCPADDTSVWQTYLSPLSEQTQLTDEVKQKKKYNTFLVFQSGNVIMSGMTRATMEAHYSLFRELVQKWRPNIEEKLVE